MKEPPVIPETIFQDLMSKRVRNILLICSRYDRFMLEEDGRIEELLFQDYIALGLRYPPKITHAPSAQKALALMNEREFELVITMLNVGELHAAELANTIRTEYPEKPIILLSPMATHNKLRELKHESRDIVDYIFTWQGNPNILLAMVKLVEDRMNAPQDTASAGVQVIILVEDSVRYYSTYLPMIYKTLIQQARYIMAEGLNEWSQTQRMRGRPKILLAKDYDEAVELYDIYRDYALGIISDITYKRNGAEDKEAGLKLCKYIREDNPEIPILLQSSRLEYKKEAEAYHAQFLHKHSETLLANLRTYIRQNYGFGNFIFRDPKTAKPIAKAEDLREMQHVLETIDAEVFLYHVNNNDISKWLKARALFNLAKQIRPKVIQDYPDVQSLREDIIATIRSYRQQRGRNTIAIFDKDRFDELSFFTRIGTGSLGGKGRGLAFINLEIKESGLAEAYPEMYLSIPRTIVLTTEMFDLFLEENNLAQEVVKDYSDKEILDMFLNARLPEDLEKNLRAVVKVLKAPMAVRSSSLLEDSHYQPFAGIYQTCMIPNAHPDFDRRVNDLCTAIKCVYASTYFRQSKDYLKATNHMIEEEKMAVIIQQVTGTRFGTYCYPNVAGVARSLNYYPIGNEKAEDGIAYIAFGFGKMVVDNGTSLRFSPRHPKRALQLNSSGATVGKMQQDFFALDMESPFDPNTSGSDNLKRLSIDDMEDPTPLKYVASTYDVRTQTVSDSPSAEGKKIITFSGLLKYNALPVAKIIRDLLHVGRQAMNVPIEIEFACNFNKPAGKKPEFSILQIRPIVEGSEAADIRITEEQIKQAVIYSKKAMGNGTYNDLYDILYIRPEHFDPAKTQEMAKAIGRINAKFLNEDRGYILIVAGRLGSTDPWLGIPTTWSQISQAKIIVETGLENFQVEPSQGTHFFQNMTSLHNAYMTINPVRGDGICNFEQLDTLPAHDETHHIRLAHTSRPLQVRVDGKTGQGYVAFSPETGGEEPTTQ
ncbi:MAG: PEP/pyruvate-binding domain-containing protein [Spirochaetota bacterium]